MTVQRWMVSHGSAPSRWTACLPNCTMRNCTRSVRWRRAMRPREFLCEGYRFVPETGTLSLRYAFDHGPSFEERIVFPVRVLAERELAALDRIWRLLLL